MPTGKAQNGVFGQGQGTLDAPRFGSGIARFLQRECASALGDLGLSLGPLSQNR